MGKAKRKKKLEPNFWKKQVKVKSTSDVESSIELEVKLTSDVELPIKLEKFKQSLIKEGKNWELGEVHLNGSAYPVVFMPYKKNYQGSWKLYCHVAFSPDCQPEVNQALIDRISQQVCQQLKDKYPQ